MDLSRARVQTWSVSGVSGAAIALIALALFAGLLYRETVVSLLTLWSRPNSSYSHGLVVVAISCVLIFRRGAEVSSLMLVRPSLSGAVLVLLASLGWLAARLVDVVIVQQVSLILLPALLVASVIGYRSAWLFAVPLTLPILAIPIWDPLVPPLQQLVATVVTATLNLTGIPAFLEGFHIAVPAGTFHVKPACSGLNQLIVAMMIGALLAHIKWLRPRAAMLTIGVAAGLSLFTNVLRIYLTVVIGQLSGMQHYLVTDHWAPGWVLFSVGMFVFVLVVSRITGAGHRPASGAGVRTTSGRGETAQLIQSALLCAGFLALGPVIAYAYSSDPGEIRSADLDLPTRLDGWQAVPALDGYRPILRGQDFEGERLYRRVEGGQPVYLYVAGYVRQEQGKEAVNELNTVYDGVGWRSLAARTVSLKNGMSVKQTRILSRTGTEKLVWQWYYLHGMTISNDYMAKLLNAWATLNGDPVIAVVVVATDVDSTDEGANAEKRLTLFVTDSEQMVATALKHARQAR